MGHIIWYVELWISVLGKTYPGRIVLLWTNKWGQAATHRGVIGIVIEMRRKFVLFYRNMK